MGRPAGSSFRLILEIAPPREPNLSKVARQVEIFGALVDAILVPDNSLGRAAMSSVVVGLEVRRLGLVPIVAINARDRNRLRFESDLITLRAQGIEEVLLLYGDPIAEGRSDLTVRRMLANPAAQDLRRGVAVRTGRQLGWRASADFVVAQMDFRRSDFGGWLVGTGFPGPAYGGVLAVPDEAMGRRMLGVPGLEPPSDLVDALGGDSDAGFRHALGLLDHLRVSGADGAHLVVPARWRRFAEMLAEWLSSRDGRSPAPLGRPADRSASPEPALPASPGAQAGVPGEHPSPVIRLESPEPVWVGRENEGRRSP